MCDNDKPRIPYQVEFTYVEFIDEILSRCLAVGQSANTI